MMEGAAILSWSSSSNSLAYHGLGGGTGRSKLSGSVEAIRQTESGVWSVKIGSGLYISQGAETLDARRIQWVCFFSNTEEATLYIETIWVSFKTSIHPLDSLDNALTFCIQRSNLVDPTNKP
jgi:hypothetical protein